jgi:hypothetical protein
MLLTLFFLNTSRRFYLREISGKVGMSAGAFQRELKNLIEKKMSHEKK